MITPPPVYLLCSHAKGTFLGLNPSQQGPEALLWSYSTFVPTNPPPPCATTFDSPAEAYYFAHSRLEPPMAVFVVKVESDWEFDGRRFASAAACAAVGQVAWLDYSSPTTNLLPA